MLANRRKTRKQMANNIVFATRRAIRRAHRQFGSSNVHVSSAFLRRLAAHTGLTQLCDPKKLQTAFVAPLTSHATHIDPSNVCWVVPTKHWNKTAFSHCLAALNKTRKECGLPPVNYTATNNRVLGSLNARSCTSRSISRYFYLKHYMQLPVEPGQPRIDNIDKFLKTHHLLPEVR